MQHEFFSLEIIYPLKHKQNKQFLIEHTNEQI
jgi:hypothetical protein